MKNTIKGRWGVFMHFLAIPASTKDCPNSLTPDSWSKRVDDFRVDLLAEQLYSVGADYMFLTLGQNSGYYCSPNNTLDSLTGRDSVNSRCSRRDLVMDLSAALDKYRIPLYVYLPSHAPMSDFEAVRALGYVPEWDFSRWSPPDIKALQAAGTDPDPRLANAQRNYEAVIREWSERWGKRVHGWWFDGCYYYDTMYQSADEPNFHSFAAAARSGNPASMTCFNCGVKYPPCVISDEDDYSAGECTDLNKLLAVGLDSIQGIQRHILTYIGQTWSIGPLRFSGGELQRYTELLNRQQAVVSWDVPYNLTNGTLDPDVLEALAACSQSCISSNAT